MRETPDHTSENEKLSEVNFNHYNQLRLKLAAKIGELDFYETVNRFIDKLSEKNGGLDNVRQSYLFHALIGSTPDLEKPLITDKNNPINQAIIEFLSEKEKELKPGEK